MKSGLGPSLVGSGFNEYRPGLSLSCRPMLVRNIIDEPVTEADVNVFCAATLLNGNSVLSDGTFQAL